ncbi:MAG: hypothetical protein FJZ66_09920 [Bacteroidetes bacterium]|nr:hypothetical protein [Bacteroidota bacterium]
MEFLFALDQDTEEVIVSHSPKGSSKINFIERIKKEDNTQFYGAVEFLYTISSSSKFNAKVFKTMDKVCQLLYTEHQEIYPISRQ